MQFKRRGLSFISLMLLLGVIATSATAAEGVFKARNVHYGKTWNMIEIGDVEGHIMGLYENTGLSFLDDGETAALEVKGTMDSGPAGGFVEGYEIRTFDDGSSITLKFEGESNKGVGSGTLTCIAGSGRFQDIQCQGSYQGGRKGSMMVFDTELNYTLAQ